MLMRTNRIKATMLFKITFPDSNKERDIAPIIAAHILLTALPRPAQNSGLFIYTDNSINAVVKNTAKKPAER